MQVASALAFEHAAQARQFRAHRGGTGVRDQLVADGETEQDFMRIQEYPRAWLFYAEQVVAAPSQPRLHPARFQIVEKIVGSLFLLAFLPGFGTRVVNGLEQARQPEKR